MANDDTSVGMETVLTVNGAAKRFGANRALDNVSFELRKGEWLGLLGPNGAGKTTLVRSIAGRVRLDAGAITLPGRKREVLGIVPQEIALYPKLTARENLQCFGRLLNLAAAVLKDRVEWALEFTGLADRAHDLVHTFSGGMKRRLNVACSVLHRPAVVLLDEPTVGVDPQSRQRTWEMLAQLRRDGASLLLTTHQLDEAQQMCDRVVVIDHGRVIADGTLAELVRNTIGPERRVSLKLGNGESVEGRIRNLASDLSSLLQQATASGAEVVDVQVESPSLQAVFIHLTGRELRD